MKNPDILDFHSSLTLNNGKLIWDFRSPFYAIVSKITHFLIPLGMREKMSLFEVWVSPVLAQKLDIWNFDGSLALNNGKLVWYLRSPLCQVWLIFTFCLPWQKKRPVFNCYSPVVRQNQNIWNFHRSLTLINGKLIDILKPLVCHCVKYDSFFHSVWQKRKMAFSEVSVSPH